MLRSCDPEGLKQEMWALLAIYQALRIAINDAIATVGSMALSMASFVMTSTARRRGASGPDSFAWRS